MAAIDVLHNECGVGLMIDYTPSFSVVCSVGKAPFHGTLHIRFSPGVYLLEFESFEQWLRSIAMQQFTIESFCRHVYDRLRELLGDVPLCVCVEAQTTVHGPVRATMGGKGE